VPSAADIAAAYPTCPKRPHVANPPVCGTPMFNDYASEQWICPKHGPALSWQDAGRRVVRLFARMWFEEEAA
jgi:hypothetical protein